MTVTTSKDTNIYLYVCSFYVSATRIAGEKRIPAMRDCMSERKDVGSLILLKTDIFSSARSGSHRLDIFSSILCPYPSFTAALLLESTWMLMGKKKNINLLTLNKKKGHDACPFKSFVVEIH